MSRLYSAALAAVALAIGLGSAARAEMAPMVRLSGATYHVAACAQAAAPGTARCHAHIVTDFRGNHLVNRFGRNPVEATAKANQAPAGYGPSSLQSAYYGVSSAAAYGSPKTVVAIVDAYGYANAAADLAVYRSTYGLPALSACPSTKACFAKVNQKGAPTNLPAQNTGWAQETALDLDMVSAMCPNCSILLVEANSSSLQDLATAVNTAVQLGARVVGNSYGGSEGGSQSLESAYNHIGVAITASSGDTGYAAGPQFPATSPHVTAVGGTALAQSKTTRGWSETAWSDAGSGCSQVYAKPAWQDDHLCAMRMEADVAADADPETGVAVYAPVSASASAWQVFGGTSASAQIIAGVYGAKGNSVIYGSAPYQDPTALNKVTSGANGACGGSYFCTAGPGYNGPTGMGTPKGTAAF